MLVTSANTGFGFFSELDQLRKWFVNWMRIHCRNTLQVAISVRLKACVWFNYIGFKATLELK